MAVRQNAALHLAPLTLRVVLGLIFLFYGAGKLFYSDFQLSWEQEATLVSLEVLEVRPGGPQPPAPIDATGGAMSAPSFEMIRAQDEEPETETQSQEERDEELDRIAEVFDSTAGDSAAEPGDTNLRSVRRVYGLVFAMNGAAQDGHWPGFLSTGAWLERMAWLAAVTEFVGGFFLLLGVFTRLWALAILGTMVVACWLTQISPWLGESGAFVGFLPPWPLDDPATWTSAYQTLFFQLLIMASAKALFFSGAGAFSVDRLIFGGRKKKTSKSLEGDA